MTIYPKMAQFWIYTIDINMSCFYVCSYMYLNGIKFYHVFTAGSYPQGNFTPEHVSDIASYYDPKFREAPVWRGHNKDKEQTLGSHEPEALGWVSPVFAIDGKLYVAFSHISEELHELIENKKFKFVSVELYNYRLPSGKLIYYLAAIGLTNRPAVEGLQPLSLKEESAFSVISSAEYNDSINKFTHESLFDESKIQDKIYFNVEVNNFTNQKNNKMQLTENTKKILTSMGLDAAKFVTEEGALEAIQKTVKDGATELSSVKSELETLKKSPAPASADDPKFTALTNEVEDLKNQRAEDLVNRAISDKKILPADKKTYVDFAKSNFSLCEKSILAMNIHSTLADQQIKAPASAPIVDLKDPKFAKPDGVTLYTYSEILKDPALQAKFTAQELSELKSQSLVFGKKK